MEEGSEAEIDSTNNNNSNNNSNTITKKRSVENVENFEDTSREESEAVKMMSRWKCVQTLRGHQGDVYTVNFHPGMVSHSSTVTETTIAAATAFVQVCGWVSCACV